MSDEASNSGDMGTTAAPAAPPAAVSEPTLGEPTAAAPVQTGVPAQSVATDGGQGDPGPVPYTRFKESREQLRESREQTTALQARIEQQEQRMFELSAMSEQFNRLQQALAPPQQEVEQYVDPVDHRLQALEGHYQSMMANQKRASWESQIETARTEYPLLEPMHIIYALGENANANIREIAKRSHENNQSRFNTWHTKATEPPPAPSQLIPGGQTGLVPGQPPPANMAEAKARMRAALGIE